MSERTTTRIDYAERLDRPESGEEPADAPVVEEYLNDPRTLPPTEWRTEVWLPLR